MQTLLLIMALQMGCDKVSQSKPQLKMYYRTTNGVTERAYFNQKIVTVDEKNVKYGDRVISVPVYNGYLPAIEEYKDQSGKITLRVFTYTDRFAVTGKFNVAAGVVNYGIDKGNKVVTTSSPKVDPPKTLDTRLFPADLPKKQEGINEVITDKRIK